MVNIFVPPEQIIDTLDLYHLPGMRKMSLRFLAVRVCEAAMWCENGWPMETFVVEDVKNTLSRVGKSEDLRQRCYR